MESRNWGSRTAQSVGAIGLSLIAIVMSTGVEAQNPPYCTQFESLNGSPSGVPLTGQDGYYIPDGTTSVDFLVFNYAGNTLGAVPHPSGNAKFVGGVGPGGTVFARAQRDVTFDNGIWTFVYDVNCMYLGQPPSAQNIGSFSLQPSTTAAIFIHLFSWVDVNNPTSWNSFYLAHDAAGTQFAQPGMSPGPQWEGLQLNHWYRFSTAVDFAQNKIIRVGMTDLANNQSASVDPVDWYLGGGTNAFPLPTSIRIFAGGSVANNTTAWDNLSVYPQGSPGTIDSGTFILGSDPENNGIDPARLLNDDGLVERYRSTFGFSATEPDLAEIRFDGTAAGATHLIGLTTRDNTNTPNTVGKVKMRDYTNNTLPQVGVYPLSLPGGAGNDQPHFTLVCSDHFINASDQFEVRIRFVAPAVFSALGFDVWMDQLTVWTQ